MKTILVVDDSMFARLNICNMLKEAGFATVEAANGQDGLEKASLQTLDCIISDLLMPELDGIGLLAALKELGIGVPVIVLTADIQETKRQQCLSLGAAGFSYKPPQKRDLIALVDQILNAGGK